MFFKKRIISIFGAGVLTGLFLWLGIIHYIQDKPVPNAIFSQSIIDSKIKAARDFNESTKVVFVGGSNVLFGVDSKQFSEITQQPALNFGCAAGMGPELILFHLGHFLKKGDVVVMRWEYGHYGFSRSGEVNLTYLNLLAGSQSKFKASLPRLDQFRLDMSIPFAHVREAFFTHFNSYVSPEIYRCNWEIDELGNIRNNVGSKLDAEIEREPHHGIMNFNGLSSDAKDIFCHFIDHCRRKGIKILVSWPNILDHTKYHDSNKAKECFSGIQTFWEAQDIKVIGSAYDYMLSEDLFYDTLYHLNSEGIENCTKLLAQQIVPFIE
jgi:hypothetical protein